MVGARRFRSARVEASKQLRALARGVPLPSTSGRTFETKQVRVGIAFAEDGAADDFGRDQAEGRAVAAEAEGEPRVRHAGILADERQAIVRDAKSSRPRGGDLDRHPGKKGAQASSQR